METAVDHSWLEALISSGMPATLTFPGADVSTPIHEQTDGKRRIGALTDVGTVEEAAQVDQHDDGGQKEIDLEKQFLLLCGIDVERVIDILCCFAIFDNIRHVIPFLVVGQSRALRSSHNSTESVIVARLNSM